MARRKYNRNQRHAPATDRSFQEYVFSVPAQQTSRTELMRLVRGGEDTFLELKVKLSNPERIAQGIVALANTGGGVIVFGVNDNMRVEGVDDAEAVRDELVRLCREEVVPALMPYIDIVSFDSGRRVVAIDVEGKRRPYRTRDGRFFLRVGAEKREATREELSELLDEARPLGHENLMAVGARVADIDESLLWSFVREFEPDAYSTGSKAGAAYPTAEVLERDLLLAVPAAAGSLTERVAPTVAGLLLFGRDERVAELLPRSTVVCARYAGADTQAPKVESVELVGNLHTLFESAVRFVERYCDLWRRGRARRARTRRRSRPRAARQLPPRRADGDPRERASSTENPRALGDHDPRQRLRQIIEDHQPAPHGRLRARGAARHPLRPPSAAHTRQTASVFQTPRLRPAPPNGGLPMLLRESRLFAGRKTAVHAVNDEFRVRLYGA